MDVELSNIPGNDNMRSIINQTYYDIFIVDEAHKKNLNIELIISLLRFFTLLNKGIKLMILSATIDEDEWAFNEFFNGLTRIRVHETKQRMKKSELRRTEHYTDKFITDFETA